MPFITILITMRWTKVTPGPNVECIGRQVTPRRREGKSMSGIEWFTNGTVGEAVALAQETQKPIVVDFWHPTCLGCAKLFLRTYSDAELHRLAPRFLWIKYNTTTPDFWFKRLNGRFAHFWHPDLLVLDHHLIELRRIIGYLPAAELVPQLELGRALGLIYRRDYQEAVRVLDQIITMHPRAAVAPEALYWRGVAGYRVGGEAELVRTWGRIAQEYPASDWRLRADCLDVVIPEEGFSPTDPSSVALT